MSRAAVGVLVAAGVVLFEGGSVARSAAGPAGASVFWGQGVEAALPANALASVPSVSIDSVSCGSAGTCSAVGSYFDSSHHYQGLLLDEVGGSWRRGIEAVLPANAAVANGEAWLSSVSCASAGNCTAVGTYLDGSGNTEGLLLTETGGVWAAGIEAALPANALPTGRSVGLGPVSCASPGNCSAVGRYDASGPRDEGLLLSETAGVWATGVEAVLPADADSNFPNVTLSSVSCASPGDCSAVGAYNYEAGQDMATTSRGLLLSETDGSWGAGVEPVLPPSGVADSVMLNSVSCASPGNCSAVGAYSDSAGHEGLLLSESAGAWETGAKALLPPDANQQNGAWLSSVSCPSAGSCTAGGAYDKGIVLLSETAGLWASGVAADVPPSPARRSLGAPVVSCPSAGNCGAVASSGGGYGILMTETAGSWDTAQVASLPSNASGQASLTSVSCASAGQCSAVGSIYTDSSGAQQGLLLGSPAPLVTLTVSKKGAGSGTVISTPAGIDCGNACSHDYPQTSPVTLTARPAVGSAFAGWSGACNGTGRCVLSPDSDTNVTATFNRAKPCLVPRLKGKSLTTAKRSIKAHNCTVGKIKHATSPSVNKGHVISQRPKPSTHLKQGAKVSLTVSRGRP